MGPPLKGVKMPDDCTVKHHEHYWNGAIEETLYFILFFNLFHEYTLTYGCGMMIETSSSCMASDSNSYSILTSQPLSVSLGQQLTEDNKEYM